MDIKSISFTIWLLILSCTKLTLGQNNPSFSEESPSEIKGYYGKTTTLHCIVNSLGDKMVTWARVRDGHIISIGSFMYSGDTRFQIIKSEAGDKVDYALNINYSNLKDEGIYECAIITEPKLVKSIAVTINEDTRNVVFCENDEVECPNNDGCISIMRICNGEVDCVDGWDELFCTAGYVNRACRIWGCEDQCFALNPYSQLNYWNYREAPVCTCDKTGYILGMDGKKCSDVNECLENNAECDHSCVNTPGSYHCLCVDGYILSKNGHSCEKAGSDTNLFYSTSHSMNTFQVHFRRQYTLFNSSNYIVGIIFNRKSNRIFSAEKDVYSDHGEISSIYLAAGPTNDHLKFSSDIKCPEDIEVDQNASLIYIADMCSSEIVVFSVNDTEEDSFIEVSKIRNNLIQRPVALALDTQNEILYWADWGFNLGIQRIEMNGSDATVLVNTSIMKPKSLVYDAISMKLYWTDFDLGVIESVEVDGTDRRTLLAKELRFKPYALAVFESKIYFSNWTSNAVMVCNMYQCDSNNTELLFSAHDVITDLHV